MIVQCRVITLYPSGFAKREKSLVLARKSWGFVPA